MNRQITSRIATYHFAPTALSKNNLLNEGVNGNSIYVTGNTVIDALYWVINRIKSSEDLKQSLSSVIQSNGYEVSRLIGGRKMVLITGHRRENFGQGFLKK